VAPAADLLDHGRLDLSQAEVERVDGLFPGVEERVGVEGRQGDELAGLGEAAARDQRVQVGMPPTAPIKPSV